MLEERKYIDLHIYATEIGTEVWVGDDEGHFVEKGIGVLKTRLLPGKYTVSFGLDGEKRLIELKDEKLVVTED